MSSVPQYIPHYTVDNYLCWEGDWELWEGIPVAMTPSPFGRHQLVASRLLQQLRNQLQEQGLPCEAIHELDWIVRNDLVVRPDIVVVCNGVPEKHLEQAPTLIAEIVSESTAEKDRTVKYRLYEREQVAYYLLVDPTANEFCLYQLDENQHKYRELPSADAIEFHLAGRPMKLKVESLLA